MTAQVRPVAAVRAEVQAALVAAGDVTPHFEGAEAISANNAPPRYVWVETTQSGEQKAALRGYNPPSVAATKEHVEIHCWGETRDQAYELRNNVLVALKRACGADVQLERGEWMHFDRSGNSAWRGLVLVQEVSIAIPVADEILPIAVITDVGHEVDIVFPTHDEVACST